ncbi:hypothetical protein SPBR_01339 [Sporothrix brasiliensis 5110]|uniref:Nitrogen regulatory protein areA GATA-like domain-containing protein n=1 Tax=Sporothrix brasiliensis 5110 TaxID=1398154 RepID=A0A0C2J2T2_9PEZI|nr:uncharacterized protein SPBR_01339 [Sporothrix brasiliensis 5110]KIH91392.1 hypothetical protein SPBR_01339 [Sporothrix brasiliensis 5110]
MATPVIPGSDRGSLKATKADRLCESEKPTSSSNDISIQVAGLVKQATAAASKTDPPTHVPLDAAALALHNAEQDSIEAALPILPRGFVENTAEIYAEVASFDVIPPEKLREYWRVYTITHRKLYDPTANRLENFWWHVWGSKRRGLSGKIVAKLYENISTGPTFVPLRTPASRYDGPTSASEDQRPSQDAPVPGASSHAAAVAPKRVNNADSTTEGERADTGTLDHKQAQQDAHVKLLSSSSTRPAPAQSILRKPRPSLSGPRPTPRFALPSSEPSEAEEDEQNVQLGGSSEANEDAVTSASSIGNGNGSTDTNHSDHRESKPIKHSSNSSNNSGRKPASSKREAVTKSGKGKAAKKKFVVNSSASKRRTVVSKRSGSHGSQSSGASEGPGSRETPSYFPPRHSGESLVGVEEEELEDAILPPALSSPQSPNPMPSKSRVLEQQRRSPKLAAMTEKSAGKQPAGHQPLADPERTSSPASESTAVSSLSGSVAGSATGTTAAPAPTLATASRKRSSFAQYVTGASGGPVSLASSGGSSGGLEVPVAFRNRQSTQRPKIKIPGGPEAIPRPGGGLIRQSTMPYEPGQSHRQQLSRIGLTTTMSSSRGTAHALPPTSAYVGPGSAAAPGLSAAAPAAPMMGRSMSQDSYGTRPRLVPGYQSPILGPMRSSTVTAASMVAAKGVFMDAEGPDTFELYAKTGLEEPPEEPDDDDKEDGSELPAYMSETGSFSSSFQAPSSFQNAASSSFQDTQPALPRPLFTPTRPAQTPRIPFARTRSQLNVILDREKERLGEGSYASWQESRTRDQHETGDREHRNS